LFFAFDTRKINSPPTDQPGATRAAHDSATDRRSAHTRRHVSRGDGDRLLDFSRAVTGTLFFVPTATFLEDVAPDAAAPSTASTTATEGESAAEAEPQPSAPAGSLGIGSLKKEPAAQ